MLKRTVVVETSSFRDPSGFIFYNNNSVYRQINLNYKDNYDFLMASKLYKTLTNQNLLIRHQEVKASSSPSTVYKTIQVEKIPFISYPYEWCFSQLKDAALLTLQIQKIALNYGMSLKDASAYNIQFLDGKPIFIDTLSFEKKKEDAPWVAYRQFCQHFLAPLSLMSEKDLRLSQLMRVFIDGIPLNLASTLLPVKTWSNLTLLAHIHLHAKGQQYFASKQIQSQKLKLKQDSLVALIDSLENYIQKLKPKQLNSHWEKYYTNTNYTPKAFNSKKGLVKKYLDSVQPKSVWDIGANTGEFSLIAGKKGIFTVSLDNDQIAVEKNYLHIKAKKITNILPLVIDLTNPSPNLGWANAERQSLTSRGPTDLILALAIVHHLAIANNLPLKEIARYLSSLCKYLVIEFVPKQDSQVQKLLASRDDIFPEYHEKGFEKAFGKYFVILRKDQIVESERMMYLMQKNK